MDVSYVATETLIEQADNEAIERLNYAFSLQKKAFLQNPNL